MISLAAAIASLTSCGAESGRGGVAGRQDGRGLLGGELRRRRVGLRRRWRRRWRPAQPGRRRGRDACWMGLYRRSPSAPAPQERLPAMQRSSAQGQMPASRILFRRPAGLADGLARKEPALLTDNRVIRPKQPGSPAHWLLTSGSAWSETYTTGRKDAHPRPAMQVAPRGSATRPHVPHPGGSPPDGWPIGRAQADRRVTTDRRRSLPGHASRANRRRGARRRARSRPAAAGAPTRPISPAPRRPPAPRAPRPRRPRISASRRSPPRTRRASAAPTRSPTPRPPRGRSTRAPRGSPARRPSCSPTTATGASASPPRC